MKERGVSDKRRDWSFKARQNLEIAKGKKGGGTLVLGFVKERYEIYKEGKQ